MVNSTAQVSLKMPKPRLSIRATDQWFNKLNTSGILFQIFNFNVDSNAQWQFLQNANL